MLPSFTNLLKSACVKGHAGRGERALPPEFDFAVVGAGPNGLSAASSLSLEFPNRSTVVIEQGEIGHHISLYPDVQWHSSMAGLKLGSALDDVIPNDYLPTSSEFHRYLKNFAEERDISTLQNSRVDAIAPSGEGRLRVFFKNHSGDGVITARYVILATGIFENQNPIPRFNRDFRRHLDITLTGKRIAILGGGASAVDAVRYLLPENEVFWVIRGNHEPDPWREIQGAYEEVRRKFAKNLSIFLRSEIQEADGRDLRLSGGDVLENIDEVFALVGYSAVGEFVHGLGLETSQGLLTLDKNLQTQVRNVFAFGAMATRRDSETGRLRQSFVDRGNKDSLSLLIRGIKLDLLSPIMHPEGLVDIEQQPEEKTPIVKAVFSAIRPIILFRRRLLGKIRALRGKVRTLVSEIAGQ